MVSRCIYIAHDCKMVSSWLMPGSKLLFSKARVPVGNLFPCNLSVIHIIYLVQFQTFNKDEIMDQWQNVF
jgi:hypothetical protein